MDDWKALCVRQGMELKAKEEEIARLKGLLSENATPFLNALLKEEDRLRLENNQLRADKRELVEVCEEAILEIEYLHDKFTTTGSGNGILSKLISAVEKHKERE